jgi:hypothetical protein
MVLDLVGALPVRNPMKAAVVPVVVAAGIGCAPLAQADPGQAGLSQPFSQAGGPFIGSWGAHGEGVTVNADGTGTETARRGTLSFRLSTVQTNATPWDTAYGNVTGGFLETGSYVTIQVVDGGNGMLFSAGGGDNGFPFCKIVGGNAVNRNDCGA